MRRPMRTLGLLLLPLSLGAADIVDCLVPQPQRVVRAEGTAAPAAAGLTVTRGRIEGVPEDVMDQAYVLTLSPTGHFAVAYGSRGGRYAQNTWSQLMVLSKGKPLPAMTIVDWPHLKWRGFMNDCGRNYLALDGVKAILDTMAFYKMNLFHWHLSDYHGWRLESKKYPQLNKPEAFRRQIGRFYTQDEFREIVRYAANLGITVMPELDVPGHTLALRKGLGIASMAAPGTDRIVSELFEEVCSLADAETMPFVHIGTDEVRTKAEYCDETWPTKWARTVNAAKRAAVVWAPGKKLDPSVRAVDMVWHDNYVTNSVNPFFDSARMYLAYWTPFEVLNRAQFIKPCRWAVAPERKLGAITCCWHDDNVGDETLKLFRECMVFPSIVAMADNYWKGRETDEPDYLVQMPPVGTAAFARAQAFEKRLVAQRDCVLEKFEHPFIFFAQTPMRWRIVNLATGKVLRRDLAQGTLRLFNKNKKLNLIPPTKDRVAIETWIYAPSNLSCGAWIDLTHINGVYGRLAMPTTPKAGAWNQFDAKVELNRAVLPPPVWRQPGLSSRTKPICEQDIPYSTDLLEVPLVDEMPGLRAPYPVSLKKGWNHFRISMETKGVGYPGFSFALFLGETVHPREVPGLRYRCDPPGETPREGVTEASLSRLDVFPDRPGQVRESTAGASGFAAL
jgi:hypothetical protein